MNKLFTILALEATISLGLSLASSEDLAETQGNVYNNGEQMTINNTYNYCHSCEDEDEPEDDWRNNSLEKYSEIELGKLGIVPDRFKKKDPSFIWPTK